MHILPAMLHQHLRHTGARGLVRSSTVSNDGAITWNLVEVLLHFVGRNPNRARKFRRRLTPRSGIARIDERKHLATSHALFHFVNRNSRCFHLALLVLRIMKATTAPLRSLD